MSCGSGTATFWRPGVARSWTPGTALPRGPGAAPTASRTPPLSSGTTSRARESSLRYCLPTPCTKTTVAIGRTPGSLAPTVQPPETIVERAPGVRPMATVVFVHGVGKQYLSEDSLARDVVPELRGGVRLAVGAAPGPRGSAVPGVQDRATPGLQNVAVPDPQDIAVAFYGDQFRPSGARSRAENFGAADVEDELEFELLMAWWAEAARVDPRVPPPDESGSRGAAGWAASRGLRLKTVRRALDALTGADFLRGVLDRALIGDLKQLVGYLTEPEIRTRARACLADRITADTRVVVAHSLGSVVAYETLCEAAARGRNWDVHMLVTLGSPLGMRALVRNR